MAKKKEHIPDRRKATKAQVAEFFDVSLPTVETWIRKGCPIVERGGKGIGYVLDLREVARWHFGSLSGPTNNNPDHMQPADRKAWYEAEARKRDLELKAGELVPRAAMAQAVSTAFAAVTQDLLAIPDQLERLHGVPAEVAAKVDNVLCGAIESLRGKMGEMAPEVAA